MASVLEVGAISVFVFLVMAELSPDSSLLLLCGVFFCQIAVDCWQVNTCSCSKVDCVNKTRRCRRGYEVLIDQEQGGLESSSTLSNVSSDQMTTSVAVRKVRKATVVHSCFKTLFENKFVKCVALLLQFVSLGVFIGRWCYVFIGNNHSLLHGLRMVIAAPLCLLVLSFVWTNKFQEWIASVNKIEDKTARFKSSKLCMTIINNTL